MKHIEKLDATRPRGDDYLQGPQPNSGTFQRETRKKINEIIDVINTLIGNEND